MIILNINAFAIVLNEKRINGLQKQAIFVKYLLNILNYTLPIRKEYFFHRPPF